MTNFIIIDPTAKAIHNYDAPDYKDACRAAGLDPSALDHGTIARARNGTGYGIWVYELGLKAPLVHRYFALDRQLFNGPAVIYAFDTEGETVDIPPAAAEHIRAAHLSWFDSAAEVEQAIQANLVDRPQSSINGEVFWQWKGPSNV